ncbi:MAG: thrombospondin type 3 repeat-containing protein [Deltaproteobacteria bacterium]|nr:thrombospondin type 3 repeat-containing protein [Deltaproteobacteria bacterium]
MSVLSVLSALSVLGLGPPSAHAQSAQGWALGRYEPATTGDSFFANEMPWYSDTRAFALAITGDFARTPLVLHNTRGEPLPVIDGMLQMHLHGAFSVLDRVGISGSLPISLMQIAGAQSGMVGLSAYTAGPVTGDARLGMRVRVFGDALNDAWSLHVGGQVYLGFIPYSGDEHFVTDESLRGRISATVAGQPGPVRYSATVGYHFRRSTQVGTALVDGELFASTGAALVTLHEKLHVGPELWLTLTPASLGRANVRPQVGLEAILGINYHLQETWQIGVAAGPGLIESVGTPSFRAMLRVGYVPTRDEARRDLPSDRDQDTVIDELDECPDESATTRPDPARRGCPAPRVDTDEDGVMDDTDLCPAVPEGTVRDSGRPGCPLPDQDHDGVADTLDVCVDSAAGEHTDPERPGCPAQDTDGDGVWDHEDQCPSAPQGPLGDPARPGCAAPDTDGDSVLDPEDACVSEAGVPNASNPAVHGCPTHVRFVGGTALVLDEVIVFDRDNSRVSARSRAVMDDLARAMQALPALRFEIQSHDGVHENTADSSVTHSRAVAVLEALVARGVAHTRLEAHGYGTNYPEQPTTGLRGAALRDARAANTRIVINVRVPATSPGR